MRTIRIIRPKNIRMGAVKARVSIDGKEAGKLPNGKELTAEVDEKEHHIYIAGGTFAPRDFQFEMTIPAGSYSYTFQTEMMDQKSSAYKPVLRPSPGEALKDDVAVRTMVGVNTIMTLFDEKLRSWLREHPEALIRVNFAAEKWFLTVEDGGEKTVIMEQLYKDMTGRGIAGAVSAAFFADETEREKVKQHVFENYFRFLPDYEIAGPDTLRFKG